MGPTATVLAMIELDSLEGFDEHVATHGHLNDVVLQGLDLCRRTEALLSIDVHGVVLLGCVVESEALRRLHDTGALVFPPFRDLPFQAFRNGLYTADELYAEYVAGGLEAALDTRIYRWFEAAKAGASVVDELAQRIHDHAIDDALAEVLADGNRGQGVIAIMGGHGMTRTEPEYAAVARLARALTRRGCFCASGGGPGAMEATNLGAWMAPHEDAALDQALSVLAGAATFQPIPRWLDAAWEVRRRWPLPASGGESLGVPTWHYGHEPPNVFATHIAKYFANSIREDGLLAIALAGVVFAPGSAGTIQEVFQDAAQNHYRSFGTVSPMVFFGSEYWTVTKPVYPLLRQLAAGHDYADHLSIHDDIDAIVDQLTP